MSARPQCSVFIAASLDGYIARADGGLDWLAMVERAGEDYGYRDFLDAVDALVMGRRTYDSVLEFEVWPYPGKRCIVMTHAPPAPRHGEEFASGAPASLLARLGEQGVRRLYVDGGALIRQFLAAGLVDDLTLSVIPVLLGSGIRLFEEDARARSSTERKLRLVTARPFDSGLVQLCYQLS